MHISVGNISKRMTTMANILITTESRVGFRLVYFDFTFAYSKGKLGHWNGVNAKYFGLYVL